MLTVSCKLSPYRDGVPQEIRQSIFPIRFLRKGVGKPFFVAQRMVSPQKNFPYTLSWKGRGETVRILFDSEGSAKIWDEFFVFGKAERGRRSRSLRQLE